MYGEGPSGLAVFVVVAVRLDLFVATNAARWFQVWWGIATAPPNHQQDCTDDDPAPGNIPSLVHRSTMMMPAVPRISDRNITTSTTRSLISVPRNHARSSELNQHLHLGQNMRSEMWHAAPQAGLGLYAAGVEAVGAHPLMFQGVSTSAVHLLLPFCLAAIAVATAFAAPRLRSATGSRTHRSPFPGKVPGTGAVSISPPYTYIISSNGVPSNR